MIIVLRSASCRFTALWRSLLARAARRDYGIALLSYCRVPGFSSAPNCSMLAQARSAMSASAAVVLSGL